MNTAVAAADWWVRPSVGGLPFGCRGQKDLEEWESGPELELEFEFEFEFESRLEVLASFELVWAGFGLLKF